MIVVWALIPFIQTINSDYLDLSDNEMSNTNVGDIVAQYETEFRSENKGASDSDNDKNTATLDTNDYDPEIIKQNNRAIEDEERDPSEKSEKPPEEHQFRFEDSDPEEPQEKRADESDIKDINKINLVKWSKWCKLQPELGNCTRLTTRYYYNPSKSQCLKFSYSGCFGNENNFMELEDCERHCMDQPEDWKWDIWCQLQKIEGNCTQTIPRYYYNAQAGKCKSFVYSGCSGNRNKFATITECERYCKKHRNG